MKEVKGLKPFGKFIMTIGQLPASYLVSMTYEEQLIWFCNYLQNTVIPTVNNNGEAVEELQNLYIQLKEYVDNYFENLDVQEEIDNKLDEMAESGELAEIIAQFLDVGVLFVYDTASDLAGAENLNDGSSAYILGKETYNDGKGAFYKIRELQNTDTPDGDNIITLTETSNLVAEKLPNYRLNEIENTLETLTETTIPGIEDDITTINETTIPNLQTTLESEIEEITNREIIIVGDSYLAGQGLSNPSTENFGYLLCQKLGLSSSQYHLYAEGGSSFYSPGSLGHTWQQLLASKVNELTPDNITEIYFLGGYNEVTASTPTQIENAMIDCISYAKTTFQNAKIYVSLIANNASTLTEQIANRNLLKNRIYNVYKNSPNYGAIFLPKGQLPLQDYTLFENNATAVHPNANGHVAIANWLFELINNGDSDFTNIHNAFNATIPSSIGSGSFTLREDVRNNEVSLFAFGNVSLTNPLTAKTGDIDFGEQGDIHFLRHIQTNNGNNQSTYIPIQGVINTGTSETSPLLINFRINPSGHLVMHYYNFNNATSVKSLIFNWEGVKFSVYGC